MGIVGTVRESRHLSTSFSTRYSYNASSSCSRICPAAASPNIRDGQACAHASQVRYADTTPNDRSTNTHMQTTCGSIHTTPKTPLRTDFINFKCINYSPVCPPCCSTDSSGRRRQGRFRARQEILLRIARRRLRCASSRPK